MTLIDRHAMEEVFAFSVDFAHAEGGRNPIGWVDEEPVGQLSE